MWRRRRRKDREKLRAYLDDAINEWRKVKQQAITYQQSSQAECYIDAYQSVRLSILGELLK